MPLSTQTEETNPARILIADDTDDIRAMIGFMLKRKGFAVLEACNGQEAIEVACAETPDLILMDISMPVLNGLDAIRQLKAIDSTREIPIVAISAHCHDSNYRKQALDLGCVSCLAKPIPLAEINFFLPKSKSG
ncbi:response regulator [bacterium]|nr:MAG: response regulator [bacterium]